MVKRFSVCWPLGCEFCPTRMEHSIKGLSVFLELLHVCTGLFENCFASSEVCTVCFVQGFGAQSVASAF